MPATAPAAATIICAAALAFLVYSFAADIVILLSARPHG
jgi:hypothetical protein